MREEEVAVLRRHLFLARAEVFQMHQRIKTLEAHLFRLAELVLAGEGTSEEAMEIASRSLALLTSSEEE